MYKIIPKHLQKLQVFVWVCKFIAESRIIALHEEGSSLDHSRKRLQQRREQDVRNCICTKKNRRSPVPMAGEGVHADLTGLANGERYSGQRRAG